jgi:dipeptidyl aminopeptidase/acylaminoacyl peptidase
MPGFMPSQDAPGPVSVAALGLMFPATDFVCEPGSEQEQYAWMAGVMFADAPPEHTDAEIRDIARRISPVCVMDSKLPPTFVVHGTKDRAVPYTQTVAFIESAKALGTPIELLTVEGADHNWPAMYEEVEKLAAWLDNQLGRNGSN